MTGFNLPPGCNVSDLPGNTPADQAAEALGEMVGEWMDKQPTLQSLSDEQKDVLHQELCDFYNRAYSEGAQAAADDAAVVAQEIADRARMEEYMRTAEAEWAMLKRYQRQEDSRKC